MYDGTGRRVAGEGPDRADRVVRDALRTSRPKDDVREGRLLAAVPLVVSERVEGAVRAVRSDTAVEHSTHGAWLALAAASAALVFAAVLAALVLGRRLALPLEHVAGAARRLGGADFTASGQRSAIPELDAVSEALDATARRLDDLLARERAFSADASHQLRTPLAALRLELEAAMIEHEGGRSAELAAALAQVDRLQATIETLLAAARDLPRPVAADTDLTAALDRAETRWRGPLADRSRPLRVRPGPAHAAVVARLNVLDEVLDVLLDNALRHGDGSVTVAVRDLDGWLAVDVIDEGRGFTEPTEAAFRRRPDGGDDGHGIGLSLARSLAEAEGGRLSVGRPGPGPRVTLLLPRRPP